MPHDVFELPAPEGNTIVGNLIDLNNDPLGFLTRCRDYGNIVPLRLGLTPACLLTSPNLIEQVLKDRDTFIKPYPTALQPVGTERVKTIFQEVRSDTVVQVTEGVNYPGWSLDGKIPASVIRVRVGDTVNYTLQNQAEQGHSIDFHAANAPWDRAFHTIAPGKKFSISWKPQYPGVFMYHCVTPLTVQHVANGMYGMTIVDPEEPLPPAREYAIVQSEFYYKDGAVDYDGMSAGTPQYVVFNGTANQYQNYPLIAKAGERIRLYVLNAGPNLWSAFHAIGAIFDVVYTEGNPRNATYGHQVVNIAPAGGAICEMTLNETGLYPLVTHSFAHASKGAVAMLKVV